MNQTLYNTRFVNYGQDTVYLLGTGPKLSHFLCSARGGMLSGCATDLSKSRAGTNLTVVCGPNWKSLDDHVPPEDLTSYVNRTLHDQLVTVMSLAGSSTALNSGETDSAASNPNLLTALMAHDDLEGSPTTAEAWAVLLMPALALAGKDAPLIRPWVRLAVLSAEPVC